VLRRDSAIGRPRDSHCFDSSNGNAFNVVSSAPHRSPHPGSTRNSSPRALGAYYTFDATQREPRGGRIAVAYGRDATDVALFTEYGPVKVKKMTTWVELDR
jgi:hypothetical protein